MANLIEIHIIESYPSSNLVRNEDGTPKSGFFGGAQRARISPAALKRPMRLMLKEAMPNYFGGLRLKNLSEKLGEELKKLDVADAEKYANAVADSLGKNEDGGEKTKSLLYLSKMEIEAIAKKIGKTPQQTKQILDDLTYKGLLHDIGGYSHFIAIAHLFNMGFKYKKAAERLGGIKAAELYQQFFIEDKFYHRYTSSDAGTSLVRVVPVNKAIDFESKVSKTEEIHGIIDTCQLPIVATDCPCRKRTETLGIREDKCKHDFPIEETCFQVGLFGGYFKRRGEGR